MERNVATYNNLNFGQLLGALNALQRDLIRQIENIQKKLNNAEVAVAFDLVCLKEYILFCMFKIYHQTTILLCDRVDSEE